MTELEIAKTEYYDKYFGHEMAKIGPNEDRYMLVLCATGLRGKPLTDIQIETRRGRCELPRRASTSSH